MREYIDFTKAYARSFRGVGELILFVVGMIALLLSFTVEFAGLISAILFMVFLVFAAKQTWSREHAKYVALDAELFALKDSTLTFGKLSPIQQAIVTKLSESKGNSILILRTLGGLIFHGLEELSEEHGSARLDSEIRDLASKGVLEFTGYSGSRNTHRNYTTTNLFFDITDA